MANAIKYKKTTVKDLGGGVKYQESGPSPIEQQHGYKLRRDHVEKSQVVPFCTNLHIDFLQSAR